MNKKLLKKKALLFYAIVLSFLVLLIGSLFAQEGRLKGMVVNENKKPLENVKITLFDRDRGIKFECSTDKDGKYYRRGIKPSFYEITFEKEGYITIRDELRVRLGSEETLNIVMKKVKAAVIGGADFVEAEKLYKEEKYKEAAEAFSRVIEGNPNYAEAYSNLGRCYLKMEQLDNAIENLSKAVELKPSLAVAHYYLGDSYLRKGEFDKGKSALAKASELEPSDAQFHFNIAATYYNHDFTDESIAEWLKVGELDPNMDMIYYHLGLAYFKKAEFKKSIEVFEKFLQINPQSPRASEVKVLIEEIKKLSSGQES